MVATYSDNGMENLNTLPWSEVNCQSQYLVWPNTLIFLGVDFILPKRERIACFM